MFDDGDDDGVDDEDDEDDEDEEDGDTELFPFVHPSMPNPRSRFRATEGCASGPCEHIVNFMRLDYLPLHGKTMRLRPEIVLSLCTIQGPHTQCIVLFAF